MQPTIILDFLPLNISGGRLLLYNLSLLIESLIESRKSSDTGTKVETAEASESPAPATETG